MSNIRGFSDIKKQDSGKGAPGGMPPGFPGFPGFPGIFISVCILN